MKHIEYDRGQKLRNLAYVSCRRSILSTFLGGTLCNLDNAGSGHKTDSLPFSFGHDARWYRNYLEWNVSTSTFSFLCCLRAIEQNFNQAATGFHNTLHGMHIAFERLRLSGNFETLYIGTITRSDACLSL